MPSCATILVSAITLSLATPLFDASAVSDWEPKFTDAADLKLTSDTVAFATHSSRHFDPLRRTGPGLNRVVATMKQHGLPVLYLHDQHNSENPAWLYLYDDWQPTAFLRSDIGHFELDFTSVRHVVCVGGYFTLCQNNTVSDAVRNWQRDAANHDLRITQVVDGIFDLGDGVLDTDPFRPTMRKFLYDELKAGHPDAVMSLEDMLRIIGDKDQAVGYLRRRLPALPAEVDVTIDFFGDRTQIQEATFPASETARSGNESSAGAAINPPRPPRMLTFAYRTSFSFLDTDRRVRSSRRASAEFLPFRQSRIVPATK
ncbi:MAG: hypothetical protein R3C19_24460 [Planctomycetaceae bacterium]